RAAARGARGRGRGHHPRPGACFSGEAYSRLSKSVLPGPEPGRAVVGNGPVAAAGRAGGGRQEWTAAARIAGRLGRRGVQSGGALAGGGDGERVLVLGRGLLATAPRGGQAPGGGAGPGGLRRRRQPGGGAVLVDAAPPARPG